MLFDFAAKLIWRFYYVIWELDFFSEQLFGWWILVEVDVLFSTVQKLCNWNMDDADKKAAC